MNEAEQRERATKLAEIVLTLQAWGKRVAAEVMRQMETQDPIVFAEVEDEVRQIAENAAFAGAQIAMNQIVEAPDLVDLDRLLDFLEAQNGRP